VIKNNKLDFYPVATSRPFTHGQMSWQYVILSHSPEFWLSVEKREICVSFDVKKEENQNWADCNVI
jgi:predicted ATPase